MGVLHLGMVFSCIDVTAQTHRQGKKLEFGCTALLSSLQKAFPSSFISHMCTREYRDCHYPPTSYHIVPSLARYV